MKTPTFPDDFTIRHADGGASYWHWHPDTPPDYDGTWPADQEPPPWAGGLMISTEETTQANLETSECMLVAWVFGPELEDGPFWKTASSIPDVQIGVDQVIAERNKELEVGRRAE